MKILRKEHGLSRRLLHGPPSLRLILLWKVLILLWKVEPFSGSTVAVDKVPGWAQAFGGRDMKVQEIF